MFRRSPHVKHFKLKRIGTEMKRLLAATIGITACLFPCLGISSPSLATVANSYCVREAIRETESGTVTMTNIYVSETSGAVLEICVNNNDTKLSITGRGEMTLLQRDHAFDIEYYKSGSREDRIRSIGPMSFDYYTRGPREGKVKRVGAMSFDYYTSGLREGMLKQVGNLRFDYYTSGFRAGKLESIGGADFDYERNGRMETDGALSNANITIVDFIDTTNPD